MSALPEASSQASQGHSKVLSLRNVGVRYGRRRHLFSQHQSEFWALRDVTLDLFSGETLGVIGRNGAGKTTLLKVLAGILRPDSGSYVNNGYRATLLSLQVGFVGYLSGRENAILSGLLLGMHRHEIERKMDAIISFSGLEDFIDEPIQTYSSGMKARLGFSTAFQVDPDILLVDEVMGVGDAEFTEKSKAVMREKIRSDKTVVLVSHNTDVIRSLADRVAWIEKGGTVAQGGPDDVLEAYAQSQRRNAAD